MSRNLLVESLYPPLVMRHIGAAHGQTAKLTHAFPRDSNPPTGNRRTFLPLASGAMTSTLITAFPGREIHVHSSIVLSTR